MDRTEIPKGNIKERWRKDAGPNSVTCPNSEAVRVTTQMDAMKRSILVTKALALANTEGQIDDDEFANEPLTP